MDKDEVQNLARLARIDIKDEEARELSNEFGDILQYVGEVKEAVKESARKEEDKPIHRNVMRDDTPHESGIYTEKILKEAPDREGNYIRVKKIL